MKFKPSIANTACVLYAVLTLNHVWLAFNRLEYSPLFYYFSQAVGYMCVPFGLLAILTSQRANFKKLHLVTLIMPFTYYFMCIFNNYENSNMYLEGLRKLIPISIYILFSKELKIKVFNLLYWINIILNFISLFVWICYVFNINIGFTRVAYYAGDSLRNGKYYIKWGIFAIYSHFSIIRLCGVFNEPGALGTLCALLLIIRFKKSKPFEKNCFILTGFVTFSLAFYLLIFIYILLHLIKKDKRYILLAAALVVFFVNIPNIDWGSTMLNHIAERMRITSTGISGDNRTNKAFDKVYENLDIDGKALFGYGYGYYVAGNSSYKVLILQFGYIGFLFILLEWLYFALEYNNKNKDGYILIFFFVLSLYQRPTPLISMYGYTIIFGGIAWLQSCTVNAGDFNKIQIQNRRTS